MKLSEYLHAYHEFSGKASDTARQLAFAAIAIIWIFKCDGVDKIILPSELFLPTTLIVVALACDLLQYVSASFIWKAFHTYQKHKGVKANENITASPWLSRIVLFFFCMKLFAVISGYFFLLKFILNRLTSA